MIEIFDDTISIHDQHHIKNMVEEAMSFEMYNVTGRNNSKQFVHVLYSMEHDIRSEHCAKITEYFKDLPEFKTHKLTKAKINITLPYKKRYLLAPHTDSYNSHAITYLYYIIDSDGPTVFYNKRGEKNDVPSPPWWWRKTKISPKQGRLVKFPSDMIHSGNVPYTYNSRIVLNLIFN